MPTPEKHEKASESTETKLQYWKIKNITDTKELKEANAEKLIKLRYESESKTMKLDFQVWLDKKDKQYKMKYIKIKYPNPNPYQSDPVTYTQSLRQESINTVHTLDVKNFAEFEENIKTALDSYYKGARPKTGEDKKLSEVIYEKLGFKKQLDEEKKALKGFAYEETKLKYDIEGGNVFA
ncbi:hypothetical protein FACS189428_5750 [Clostridia bacterium]|nr:hypothetical protein FACS189428_5750 [Clostridia bacterium]